MVTDKPQLWPGPWPSMLLTTSSFWFLPETFSWFSGCLEKWKKEDAWKGKLKVNFSAFLSKLHCSWTRTAFAYPCICPCQNVDLHVTTLQVLSAVTWVCAAQGSCCVNKRSLRYVRHRALAVWTRQGCCTKCWLVWCVHKNDCDILVTPRICKKGTSGALRITGFYHVRTKTYKDEAMNRRNPHTHIPWA